MPAPTPPSRRQPAAGSRDVVRRLRSGTDLLTSEAMRRLDGELDWYRSLAAEDRSWIGLVAQAGIAAFITWYEDPETGSYNAQEIFRAAPPELTRSISLQHTLQLVRIVVAVVEDHAISLAEPDHRSELREAVLVYSREVAFSAAEVYARAAEARGAWDARLEALVVDSLIRGGDDTLRSRVAALGWSDRGRTLVLVGEAPPDMNERHTAELRRACRRAAEDALVGIQGERVVIVLGGEGDLRQAARDSILPRLGPGPVVFGPEAGQISEAARSARAALAGMAAVAAWPTAPRPVEAGDLLPERALAADPLARRALIDELYQPLLAAGGPLVETLDEYLGQGRSLEGAARALYVHPNTVRYRLRRIGQLVGWDPTDAREGFVLQTALAIGRLAEAVPAD